MSSLAYLLTMIFSTLIIFSPGPLATALVIVGQALMISFLTYVALATSWLSFVLFLVFISAMMIIYAYVSSLAANDFFYLGSLPHISMPLLYVVLITVLLLGAEGQSLLALCSLSAPDLTSAPMSVYKFYASGTVAVTVFLIVYLLISLLVVAKNASYCEGSLRSKGCSML